MPDQTTTLSITTIAATPIAVETTRGLPLDPEQAADFEMIGARERLSASIGDLQALVKETATALVDSINSLEQALRPKSVEAEFSISLSAEAGLWYLAKGATTGSIKVTLAWQT